MGKNIRKCENKQNIRKQDIKRYQEKHKKNEKIKHNIRKQNKSLGNEI